MKIGILTFHKAKNYGAVLQAFALLTTLRNLGLDPYIINRSTRHKNIIHQIYFIFHPKFILQRLTWILFDQFSTKYLIPKTNEYNSNNSLEDLEEKEKIDAFIVGSDQVWRMEYSDIGYNYFFDFINGNKTRKISYAASFGKDIWEEKDSVTIRVRQLLKDFDFISVREKSAVEICSKIFNVEATHVLDPTLLLRKEDYESIILKDNSIKSNNTLVSYILNNKEAIKYCNQFAKTNDLYYTDLYYVYPFCSGFFSSKYGDKNYVHNSVPEWLRKIKNAKYVITNSYHATIFAILFKKQFIVVDHPSGGTDRINSLLGLLGLQDRFVTKIAEISLDLLQTRIDFDEIDSKLDLQKEQSLLFLKKSLL